MLAPKEIYVAFFSFILPGDPPECSHSNLTIVFLFFSLFGQLLPLLVFFFVVVNQFQRRKNDRRSKRAQPLYREICSDVMFGN